MQQAQQRQQPQLSEQSQEQLRVLNNNMQQQDLDERQQRQQTQQEQEHQQRESQQQFVQQAELAQHQQHHLLLQQLLEEQQPQQVQQVSMQPQQLHQQHNQLQQYEANDDDDAHEQVQQRQMSPSSSHSLSVQLHQLFRDGPISLAVLSLVDVTTPAHSMRAEGGDTTASSQQQQQPRLPEESLEHLGLLGSSILEHQLDVRQQQQRQQIQLKQQHQDSQKGQQEAELQTKHQQLQQPQQPQQQPQNTAAALSYMDKYMGGGFNADQPPPFLPPNLPHGNRKHHGTTSEQDDSQSSHHHSEQADQQPLSSSGSTRRLSEQQEQPQQAQVRYYLSYYSLDDKSQQLMSMTNLIARDHFPESIEKLRSYLLSPPYDTATTVDNIGSHSKPTTSPLFRLGGEDLNTDSDVRLPVWLAVSVWVLLVVLATSLWLLMQGKYPSNGIMREGQGLRGVMQRAIASVTAAAGAVMRRDSTTGFTSASSHQQRPYVTHNTVNTGQAYCSTQPLANSHSNSSNNRRSSSSGCYYEVGYDANSQYLYPLQQAPINANTTHNISCSNTIGTRLTQSQPNCNSSNKQSCSSMATPNNPSLYCPRSSFSPSPVRLGHRDRWWSCAAAARQHSRAGGAMRTGVRGAGGDRGEQEREGWEGWVKSGCRGEGQKSRCDMITRESEMSRSLLSYQAPTLHPVSDDVRTESSYYHYNTYNSNHKNHNNNNSNYNHTINRPAQPPSLPAASLGTCDLSTTDFTSDADTDDVEYEIETHPSNGGGWKARRGQEGVAWCGRQSQGGYEDKGCIAVHSDCDSVLAGRWGAGVRVGDRGGPWISGAEQRL
eukprot:GHVQ01017169.1.p1 GENE.GHVQ01017169.1~~GHVQ01017169.1.p1  ORF type:complete len:826 (+),score=186.51 GHVQ01017169.1:1429-3906(+)